MNYSNKLLAAVLVLVIFMLTACGGAGNGGGTGAAHSETTSSGASTNGTGASSRGQSAADANGNETASKVVQHAMGETEIEGTPSRVVVLEWSYIEHLLAVGVQPVGVADIAGYRKWVNVQPDLSPDVVDVGNRQEPNLEVIMSLKPDLIITTSLRAKTSYDQLDAIAPTIVFDPYSGEASKNMYADMINSFRTIADVLGKNPQAEQVVGDLEQSYEDARAKLKAAGKEGRKFVLTLAYSNQNAAVFRLLADNSTAAHIYGKMGLSNAFQPERFEPNGFSVASVEAFAALQDADLLYVVQDDDNVFDKQLKDNAVWTDLAFVKENRIYALGGDVWLWGGPLSAKKLVERTVNSLTAQ